MPVPTSYFSVQTKIQPIMEAIQRAGVPDKFTYAFLNSIGFKSTNDRSIVAVLKALGFLDDNGAPTQFYRDYKNPVQARIVLGRQLRAAYSDIFLSNEKADTLGVEKLKGVFASVSGKSDSVAQKMAGTFKALCSLADLSNSEAITEDKSKPLTADDEALPITNGCSPMSNNTPEFHYNIQI
ncbi:MAG TPA: DUF5343 domain-containing protein, partial [Candidatus Fimivivens sp.]|nr:DUF5343 domain-containing protein [Candidatus Fimivivens sp.]